MRLKRGRHSRRLIHEMHAAEDKIRASLSGQVRVLSPDEIEALAPGLVPPSEQRDDYRGYAHV